MSNASRRDRREDWEERIAVGGMQPVSLAPESERRVGTGRPNGDLRTRDHAAIVYWDKKELLDCVVPYLVEGLRVRDKVVYVADDTSVDEIARSLRERGIDVEARVRSGDLTIVSAAQAFYPDGKFDVDNALRGIQELAAAAERDGFERVRFSVEMTYLLADVPGMDRGPEFESRANDEVFGRFPFVCICSFNGNRDANGALENVLLTHPILLAGGLPLVNPYYRPPSLYLTV